MFWLGLAIGLLSGTACGFLLSGLARGVVSDTGCEAEEDWGF
jgi:hypothetical protein